MEPEDEDYFQAMARLMAVVNDRTDRLQSEDEEIRQKAWDELWA